MHTTTSMDKKSAFLTKPFRPAPAKKVRFASDVVASSSQDDEWLVVPSFNKEQPPQIDQSLLQTSTLSQVQSKLTTKVELEHEVNQEEVYSMQMSLRAARGATWTKSEANSGAGPRATQQQTANSFASSIVYSLGLAVPPITKLINAEEVVIGDAHANTLRILYDLIYTGAIEIRNIETWSELKEIIQSSEILIVKQFYKFLKLLNKGVKVLNSVSKVTFLAGTSNLLTIALLDK